MEVLIHPNPTLKLCAADVDPATDDSLRDLAAHMAAVMYDAPGVGLAATQVGVMKRVIVYDVSEDGDQLVALVNPTIVAYSEETEVGEEGCLSLPGIVVPVERSLAVTCEALTVDGTPVRIEAEGFHARVLQHETDHLDGRVIIDRATPEERKAALRRYREALERGVRPGDIEY